MDFFIKNMENDVRLEDKRDDKKAENVDNFGLLLGLFRKISSKLYP